MSTLLLAADFIERLADPRYGSAVNDDYSMRLAHVLSIEGVETNLKEEIEKLADPSAFTSHGWLWLLEWARSKRIQVRVDLLQELFAHSSSVLVRALILDIAVGPEAIEPFVPIGDVREFPNRFLATAMTRSIWGKSDEKAPIDRRREPTQSDTVPAIGATEVTLVALLQAGKPMTLYGASALLRTDWHGRVALNDFFWSLAGNLDAGSRREWIARVHPPVRRGRGRRG